MDSESFDWRYFHNRILKIARSQMWGQNLGDEHDIAQSTLRSFERRTRLPDGDSKKEVLLEDKNEAWDAIRRHMNNKLSRHRYQHKKPDVAGPRLPDSKDDPLSGLWELIVQDQAGAQEVEEEAAINVARTSLLNLVDKLFTDDLSRQVARLCLRGDSQRSIADTLNISYHKSRKCCESVVTAFRELADELEPG